MSKTAQKTEVATGITQAQSMILLKNMIRLSISSVCYLRNIFPPSCFSSRDYAGLKVHQLECAEKTDDGEVLVKHPDAFLLTQWLERGVFDALTQKFLKTLTFAVYTSDKSENDRLLETYTFAFDYPEGRSPTVNGKTMNRDTMKLQAVGFIRSLVEFSGTLDALPNDRWLTMKLTYDETITPADYEPEFFIATCSESLQFDKNVLKVKIGKMDTPFHTLNLRFAGVSNEEDDTNNDLLTNDADINQSAFIYSLKSYHDAKENVLLKKISTFELKDNNPSPVEPAPEAKISDEGVSDKNNSTNNTTLQMVKDYVMNKNCTTIRKCAQELKVSTTVVREAFDSLIAEGKINPKGKQIASSSTNKGKRAAVDDTEKENTPQLEARNDNAGVSTRAAKRMKTDSQAPEVEETFAPIDSAVETKWTQQYHIPGEKCSIIKDPLRQMYH